MTKLKNIHPGEVLLEEFLLPLNITAYRLAKDVEIPQRRVFLKSLKGIGELLPTLLLDSAGILEIQLNSGLVCKTILILRRSFQIKALPLNPSKHSAPK